MTARHENMNVGEEAATESVASMARGSGVRRVPGLRSMASESLLSAAAGACALGAVNAG